MINTLPRQWAARAAALVALGVAFAAGGLQPATAEPALQTEARFDLTGNEVVNSADVAEAAEAWAAALGGDDRARAADMNGDGAVDVADAQLVAARVGQGTTDAGMAALDQLAEATPQAVEVREFVVNSAVAGNPNAAGIMDANKGDGVCATSTGVCTLQAALQETNAPRVPAYHARIVFDIREPGGGCPALVQIVPNLDYERWLQLDDSSRQGTTIDGYTQCGASPNTGDVAGNAVIKVELVGTKFGTGGAQYSARKGVNGIEVKSANNLIRGLAFYNWDRQVELSAPGALYNRIEGNFIGTDASNTFLSKSRVTHEGEGVRIQFGAAYNVIGCGSYSDGAFQPCTDQGQANAARNIVAGNGNDGIHIEGLNASYNRIAGNYIGVAQDGRARKTDGGTSLSKNQADGVDFEDGASHNWLGGETALERNIIAGNVSDGIEISHNSRTVQNRVVGNYFGLNAYAEITANGNNGISVEDRANNTFVYRNVVGGNAQSGIRAYVLSHRNQIYENWVGVLPDGSPRPNGRHGVYLMGGSQHNVVRANVIAHNGDRGVVVSTESDADKGYFGETYFNTITKNSIYNNFREGIRLTNRTDGEPLGNEGLTKPLILGAGTSLVVGTTCAGCRVEVFIADKTQLPEPRGENSGEGRTFLGEGTANAAGQFAISVTGVAVGQLVTATTTNPGGSTSEFARNFRVGAAPVVPLTPAPTLTPLPTPTTSPVEAPDEHTTYLPFTQR